MVTGIIQFGDLVIIGSLTYDIAKFHFGEYNMIFKLQLKIGY